MLSVNRNLNRKCVNWKCVTTNMEKWLKTTQNFHFRLSSEDRCDINVCFFRSHLLFSGFSSVLWPLLNLSVLWACVGSRFFYIFWGFSFPWMHNECRSELTLAYCHLGARAHACYTLDGQLRGVGGRKQRPTHRHSARRCFSSCFSQAVKERKTCSSRDAGPLWTYWWGKWRGGGGSGVKIEKEPAEKMPLWSICIHSVSAPPAVSRVWTQCREQGILCSILQESEQSGATGPL